MDYKDLANLIFPDAKPVEYYENLYPERNLPDGAMVLRVAPSPTGNVHIGTIYQALLARKLATQSGGVFFLRIEDTDQKREIEGGISQIINYLNEFDIMPDEGMISESEWKGNYGSYKQSDRREIYEAYAKYMIERGKAYPCFCMPEELEEMRIKQENAKIRPGYYGVWAKCRNLTIEEMAEKIKNGDKYIIRFRSPGREDRRIQCSDVIKGKVVFPENDIDIPIIKADGLPTYHFAHVVDDHLMRTTIVTRGDEWLSSLPLHLQLFQEIGFKAPKYAHTAAIQKEEDGKRRKISKRKDPEASASYYSEIGIPIEAVKEYLLNIANSNFELWRKQNPDKSIEEFDFDIKKMSVSGALFDMVKLLDISKNVISKYTADKVYQEGMIWAEKHDNKLEELLNRKEYSMQVLGIERGKTKPRKDISKWSDLYDNISYMYEDLFEQNNEKYNFDKIDDKEEIKKIITLYIEKYYNYNDDKETWFNKVKDLAEECEYAREVKEYKQNPDKYKGHIGDISTVIRVMITKRKNTPDLYEIMQVLGKDNTIKRLKQFENI